LVVVTLAFSNQGRNILYIKGRREAFSIHPSVPSSVHGWHHIIILYNVKNSLAICQKLKTNFKKLKIVERKLEKQEIKSFLNNTRNFKLKKKKTSY
jgi:hypothetical protein